MHPKHTDQEYERELERLRRQLLLMGTKVEAQIAKAMRALETRDSELARQTAEADHQVNRLEVEIDELCLRVLARRQPVASDLRAITIGLKIVTDLERIGDLAVNVCERVEELSAVPALPLDPELRRTSDAVQQMVREALDAFVARDAERAQQVIALDRGIDASYEETMRRLFEQMSRHPETIFQATRLQSVAKYLERIGDHATNLAEMVVFMVKGKDIRHLGRLEAGAE